MIDSHCHLDMIMAQTGLSCATLLQRARDKGVTHILTVCVDLEQAGALADLVREDPTFLSQSIGLHPTHAPEQPCLYEDLVSAYAQAENCRAIGETGLDYFHHAAETASWQRERFACHLAFACDKQHPVIVHTRQAKEDTYALLKNHNFDKSPALIHCFTEDYAFGKKCLDLGGWISFSGIVTFKNALDIQDMARKMPLDRMLIETDAPYLAPVPYRGKVNFPEYVEHVARFIAHLRGVTPETIIHATTENFKKLMKID